MNIDLTLMNRDKNKKEIKKFPKNLIKQTK